MGRERPVPGVRHQVHAHHEETPLSSLRPNAVQQVLEPRRPHTEVRYEQTAASVRDMLQSAPSRRQLVSLCWQH